MSSRGPLEVVVDHICRVEALHQAGIVVCAAEGLWKVPGNLPEQGCRYDAQRPDGATMELKSHLPIERQARVIGATWLDHQLIDDGSWARAWATWALEVRPSSRYGSVRASWPYGDWPNGDWPRGAGSA